MKVARGIRLWSVVGLAVLGGCGRLPGGGAPLQASVWLLAAPDEVIDSPARGVAAEIAQFEGGLVVIDTSTFRPVQRLPVSAVPPGTSRVALVTTFQGSRYHPESIRALSEDSIAIDGFAGSIAIAVSGNSNGMFVDFQGATPDELNSTIRLLRAIADSARGHGLSPLGVVVPPGDTIGYPAALLARTADLIVLRLSGEHRAGTSPGPLLSPEWISRQIGIRASEIGVARLVAEFPLFGYRWNRDGTVVSVTYAEAEALVRREAGVFRRDPASGSLTATSARDGWTVWIQDAETLERLIVVARQAGVRRFALVGVRGADPGIWTRLPAALRR